MLLTACGLVGCRRPTSPQGFSEHNGGSFSENNGSSTGSPVSRDGGASSGGGAHVKGDDTFELLHERRLSPRTLARSDSDDRMLEAGNSGKFPINPLPDDHHVVLPDMSSAASDASGLDTASQFSAAAPVRPPDPPKPATPAGPAAAMAGIGVLVQRLGGMITVVDLVKGGPADMSRELKIGQVVLEVDGQSVDQTSFRNVLQLIRGPVGSWISLMVQVCCLLRHSSPPCHRVTHTPLPRNSPCPSPVPPIAPPRAPPRAPSRISRAPTCLVLHLPHATRARRSYRSRPVCATASDARGV